jgi:hypothetical protein
MAELFSPSAIGQPLALDPTLPMEPIIGIKKENFTEKMVPL